MCVLCVFSLCGLLVFHSQSAVIEGKILKLSKTVSYLPQAIFRRLESVLHMQLRLDFFNIIQRANKTLKSYLRNVYFFVRND